MMILNSQLGKSFYARWRAFSGGFSGGLFFNRPRRQWIDEFLGV